MANDLNQCNFTGRLGQDVEVRYMPSGVAVANLRLAVGKQWNDKQSGAKQEATHWFTCVAFNKTAELAQTYLGKGDQVRLTCEAQERKWQDQNGNPRTVIEFVIREMQFLAKAGSGQQGLPQGGYGHPQGNPQGNPQGTPHERPQAGPQGHPQGHPQGQNNHGKGPEGYQAHQAAHAQRQAQQRAPDPGSFDDFDDEIPFD